MADTEDVDTLKRRGRRRLVGAIALVLAAVIVLPMIFDSEPRQSPPPVSVRIPNEEETSFTPKVTPKAPEKAEAKAVERPVAKAPEKTIERAPDKAVEKPIEKAAEKPATKAEAKAQAKPADEAERKRAEAALAGSGGAFVVQVGAFAEPDKAKDVTRQLAAARLPFPHYTEQVPAAKGPVTRVRVGPFATREDAESALKRLGEIGLKGARVVTGS